MADIASPQSAPQGPVGPVRNNTKIIQWALAAFVALVAALFGLIALVYIGFGVGIVGLLIGMVLAVLPVPVYLALALLIDRYEHEPLWMIAVAFFWGATIGIGLALITESIFGFIADHLAQAGGAVQVVAKLFDASVSPGTAEEFAKGLALFILFFWKKDEFDDVIDGIVYAAMVGLGFAMVENIEYYGKAAVEGGLGGALGTWVFRGIVMPFSHPLFTSMTGIGLGWARQSQNTFIKFAAPVAGLLLAMFLHFLWDLTATLSGLAFIAYFILVAVPTFLGVLVVISFALRREARIVRENLYPYLQSGLLSQEEYSSLGSIHGRVGAAFHELTNGGFGSWRARMSFDQTASELAFHRDRVSRGITSGNDAEREAAYAKRLSDLRARLSV